MPHPGAQASVDWGSGWSAPQDLASGPQFQSWPHVALAPGGELGIATWEEQPGANAHASARLYTITTGWHAITRLDANTVHCINVRGDANKGEAIAVWLQWNSGSSRFDVWSRLYSSESAGWQSRKLVGAAGAGRAYLWVRLKDDGTAVAIWGDSAGRVYTAHYLPSSASR